MRLEVPRQSSRSAMWVWVPDAMILGGGAVLQTQLSSGIQVTTAVHSEQLHQWPSRQPVLLLSVETLATQRPVMPGQSPSTRTVACLCSST